MPTRKIHPKSARKTVEQVVREDAARQQREQARSAAPPAGLEELDKLSGYAGSIQGTPLDTAIDEQREALWLAQSIIDTVAPP